MKTIAKSLLLLIGFFAAVFTVQAKGPDEMNSYADRHGELRVEIPATSEGGILKVLLFREDNGFPFNEAHAVFAVEQPVHRPASRRTVVFKSIPYGNYAVFAYCDVNGNGSFDKGSIPATTEVSGYTKTGHTRRTVPYFEQSVFEFGPATGTVAIDWSGRKQPSRIQ